MTRTVPARFTPDQVVDFGRNNPVTVVQDGTQEWYGQRKGWVEIRRASGSTCYARHCELTPAR